MASYPVDLQPPSMVVSEEKVFVADHYNLGPKAPGIDIDVFSRAVDARNGDTVEVWSANVG